VSWLGHAFDGTWGKTATVGVLQLLRSEKLISLQVQTLALDWNDAFLQATKNSVKILKVGNKKIGYIHLWTGLHQDSATTLQRLVSELKPKIQGLVLDLRGGYGGAWWIT